MAGLCFHHSLSSSPGAEVNHGSEKEYEKFDSGTLLHGTLLLEESQIDTKWEGFYVDDTEALDLGSPDCSVKRLFEENDDLSGEIVLDSEDEEQRGKIDESSVANENSEGNSSSIGSSSSSIGRRKRLFSSVDAPKLHPGSGLAPLALTVSSNVIESQKLVVEGGKASKARDHLPDDQEHDNLEYDVAAKGVCVEEEKGSCGGKEKLETEFIVDVSDPNFRACELLERTDGRKRLSQQSSHDHNFARLGDSESQEPGESTQATALSLVDQFLLANDGGLYEEIVPSKTCRILSPPVLSARGPQRLAKKITLRNEVGQKRIFEWVNNHEDQSKSDLTCKGTEPDLTCKGTEPFSECEGHSPGSVTNPHKVKEFYGKEEIWSSKESNKNKKLISCRTKDSLYSDIEFLMENSKDTVFQKQIPEESSQENLGASNPEREMVDTFDIGFGTQIAIEAIEALSNAPPAHSDPAAVDQGSENTSENLSKAFKMDKNYFGHCESGEEGFYGSGGIAKHLRKQRLTGDKLGKQTSALSSELSKKRKSAAETKMIESPSVEEGHLHKRDRSVRSRTHVQHVSAKEFVAWDNSNDLDKLVASSASIERRSFGMIGLQGRSSKTKSNISRLQRSVNASRRIDSPLGDSGTFRGWNTKRTRSKTRHTASYKAFKGEADLKLGVKATILKLDDWRCPTRKRTRRIVSGLCMSDKLHSVVRGGWKEDILDVSNPSGHQDSICCSHNVDRKPRKQLSEKNVRMQELVGACLEAHGLNYDSAILNKRIDMKRVRAMRLREGSDMVGPGSTDIIENNCNHNMQSDGEVLKELVSEFGHVRHPRRKRASKSTLRELVNLGIPESMYEFTSKDLRKRKNITDVRVLFSQNLDKYIIKQQKKILARLAIPIASDSSTATHFIADKFARTRNMLEAIAHGKLVVTHLWLESCGQAGYFINEKNYILRDAKKEREIGFSMPITLASANHRPLLKGRRVLITPNIKPGKDMITALVKAVHGEALESETLAAEDISEDLLILSCDEDNEICVPLLNKGLFVYDCELLLNGIVIQRLEYERHQLFKDHLKMGKGLTE